ncbi:MAG: hypothetical protein R6V57_18105 [Vicinamibacterales bacterium]
MNTPDARDSTSIPDWTNVAVERIADGIDRQTVWGEPACVAIMAHRLRTRRSTSMVGASGSTSHA